MCWIWYCHWLHHMRRVLQSFLFLLFCFDWSCYLFLLIRLTAEKLTTLLFNTIGFYIITGLLAFNFLGTFQVSNLLKVQDNCNRLLVKSKWQKQRGITTKATSISIQLDPSKRLTVTLLTQNTNLNFSLPNKITYGFQYFVQNLYHCIPSSVVQSV